MKTHKRSGLIVLCLAFTLSVYSDVATKEGALWTSLIRLLANPEAYNKRVVEVMGYYSAGKEYHALFLNPEDARIGNVQSAVWINFEGSNSEHLKRNRGKSEFVRIIGTFYSEASQSYGHGGVWPAEIKNIQFFNSL